MFLAITKWTHLWFLSVSLFGEASASLSREEYSLLLYCPSLLEGRTELSISSGGWRDTVSNLLQPRRLCIYCTAHLGGWASTSNTVGKAPDSRGWARDQTQGIRASHTLYYWQLQDKEFQPKLPFIRIEYLYSRHSPPKVRGVGKLTWRLYRYETKWRVTVV